MNLRTLVLIPCLLATAGTIAVPAQAAAPVKLKNVLLRGFPANRGQNRHHEITASFFLSSNPLSENVKVTIGGRKAASHKVGKQSSTFYSAALPKKTELRWSTAYNVKVCVKGNPCQTKRVLLPAPGL